MFGFLNTAQAQLRLAPFFADHMVLQRDQNVPIWGWAKPGASISVQFNGQSATAKADNTGKWMTSLRPMDAAGPLTMTIKANNEPSATELRDVYIGEVWLCSGQSNMEWTVSQSDNPVAEVKRAKDGKIRHFKVDHDLSLTPKTELNKPLNPWTVCSPQTAGSFTGVGYFFARQIREKIGEDVAIGLINSSWGGSQVEGWISQPGMANTEALKAHAQEYPANWEQADQRLRDRVANLCFGSSQIPADIAQQEAMYSQPGFDFSKWPVGYAPMSWDWMGLWAFRGMGYMARHFDVPEFLVDSSATIFLGKTDNIKQVWINNSLVNVQLVNELAKITLAPGILKAGKNQVMVLLGAQKEPEWEGMGLHGSGSDVRVEWPDYKQQLDGELWHCMPAWGQSYQFAHLQNNVAASIYNAMIHPLVPMAMRGAIWYQGESNADRAYQYRESFAAMINDWRRVWGNDFPFLFVQLTSFGKNQSANAGSNWAELREAQEMTLQLPNTAMAVTIDAGDPTDIHPTNKQTVGQRLGLAALGMVYDKDVAYKNPRLLATDWEAATAVLNFEHVGTNGLQAKDKYGYVRGFEVAGDDKVFHYAQAQILNERQILVTHPLGQKPVAIRYAWSDAPTDANVTNSDGLPLGTFRTDQWKGVTEGKKF
jgi:sialate O-acetylesterase